MLYVIIILIIFLLYLIIDEFENVFDKSNLSIEYSDDKYSMRRTHDKQITAGAGDIEQISNDEIKVDILKKNAIVMICFNNPTYLYGAILTAYQHRKFKELFDFAVAEQE